MGGRTFFNKRGPSKRQGVKTLGKKKKKKRERLGGSDQSLRIYNVGGKQKKLKGTYTDKRNPGQPNYGVYFTSSSRRGIYGGIRIYSNNKP